MKNSLILRETQFPYIKKVILRLNNKERDIGRIDSAGEGTFLTSRKPSHLFKKSNSLGLSYNLLKDAEIKFKWISIDYENRKLVTSRNFFLKFGQVMQFEGFELQVFLPLDLFGISKARKLDYLISQQTNFFEAA
jgi:hypothetical protein